MPTALSVKRLRNESSKRDSCNQSSIEYISRNLQFVVSIENQERFSKSASPRFLSPFSPPPLLTLSIFHLATTTTRTFEFPIWRTGTRQSIILPNHQQHDNPPEILRNSHRYQEGGGGCRGGCLPDTFPFDSRCLGFHGGQSIDDISLQFRIFICQLLLISNAPRKPNKDVARQSQLQEGEGEEERFVEEDCRSEAYPVWSVKRKNERL